MLRVLLERQNCEERYNNFLFIYIFPTGTCDMILLEIKKSMSILQYFSQLIRQFLLLVHVIEKNIQLWTVNGRRKIKKMKICRFVLFAKFKRFHSIYKFKFFSPLFSMFFSDHLVGTWKWKVREGCLPCLDRN